MKVVEPPDGVWGGIKLAPNGSMSWSGMVGQLVRKEADLCGSNLMVTAERSEVVDFGIDIADDSGSIFLVNQGTAEGGSTREINFDVYVNIFQTLTWIGILLTTLLSASQYTLIKFSSKSKNEWHRLVLDNFLEGLYHMYLNYIQRSQQLLWNQGGLAMKCFVFCGSIVSHFIFTVYSSDMTAAMTTGTRVKAVKSLQELMDRGYVLSVVEGSAYHDYFKNSKPKSIQQDVYNMNKPGTLNFCFCNV